MELTRNCTFLTVGFVICSRKAPEVCTLLFSILELPHKYKDDSMEIWLIPWRDESMRRLIGSEENSELSMSYVRMFNKE